MRCFRLRPHPSDTARDGTEYDLEELEETLDGHVQWFLKAVIYEEELARAILAQLQAGVS